MACQPKLAQASGGWSGRRGSNPRPTAWKAVTLPLSYSRLRASRASPLGASAAVFKPHPTGVLSPRRGAKRRLPPDKQDHQLLEPSRSRGLEKLVGRGGFEP